jgi:hypothetical protein
MKSILITVAPYLEEHRKACTDLFEELQAACTGTEVLYQQVLYTTCIISGPKSFETAATNYHKAIRLGLPVALFEIESVLVVPEDPTEGNRK